MSCLTIIPRSKDSPLSWYLGKVQVWNGLYDFSRAQFDLGMEKMFSGLAHRVNLAILVQACKI